MQRVLQNGGGSSAVAAGVAAALLAVVLFGCGNDGREGFDISGKITFNGAPVPAGVVFFDPDVAAGNDGLQGFAEINDGRYDTQTSHRGISGGKYRVRILGFERATKPDSAPKPLFAEFSVVVDLAAASTTQDFDVPRSAATAPRRPMSQME